MQARPIAVVVGDTNADVSFALASWPAAGCDGQARAAEWGSGGSALNVACALVELGCEARLISCVGVDPLAAVALEQARRRGVELRFVQQSERARTGVCVVGVDARGERTFVSYRGANIELRPAGTERALARASLLHLSAYALLDAPQAATAQGLVQQARAHAIRVSVDLAGPPAERSREVILELAPSLWALYGNEEELSALGGGRSARTVAEELVTSGVELVAIKRGAAGCAVLTGDGPARWHEQPAFAVRARDTTGCGDAFVAACSWALLHGAAPAQAAELGNLAGAMVAERVGAAGAMPSAEELRARAAPALRTLIRGGRAVV